jgi:sugar phosphate isomerase/epimerase
VQEIAEWFADSPLRLHSFHAPQHSDPEGLSPHAMVSIAFLERQRRQDSMDEIKRALEFAESAPFRYLILHLGVVGDEFDLRKFDAALTSLENLRLFARQREVEILLENISNELSTAERLIEFFQHTHLRDMRVCFDTGHAHLDGGIEPALTLLQGKIAALHLNDNTGAKDDHLLPFAGAIGWEKVLGSLRQAAPESPLLLEVRSSESDSASLAKAAEACEKLERILEEQP